MQLKTLRTSALALGLLALAAAPVSAQVGSVIEEFTVDADNAGLPAPLSALGEFGRSSVCLGDSDGDGLEELVIGWPGSSSSASGGGALQVLELSSTGTVLDGLVIAEGSGGFPGTLDPGGRFGDSVAVLGDLDGNGVVDIAVGASNDSDVAFRAGAVWILFLEPGGAVLASQKISGLEGGLTGPLTSSDNFGASVAGLGDLDGDGLPDLAVGAPDYNATAGAVYILTLNADGTVNGETRLDDQTPAFGAALDPLGAFGAALAAPGDRNGDGHPDLLVGAPWSDRVATDSGECFVLYLDATGLPLGFTQIDLTPLVGQLELQDQYFGQALAFLDDLDGDAAVEVAVTQSRSATASIGGEFWVVSLDAADAVVAGHLVDPQTGSLLDPITTGNFASSLARIGDLDGDGTPDLVAGNSSNSIGGTRAGSFTLLRLSDGDPTAAFSPVGTTGCPPLTVAYSDQSTGPGLSNWLWDFGDGTTSTEQDPTHVYTSLGTYRVTLSVSGSGGEARQVVHDSVQVVSSPFAGFAADTTMGVPPLTVEFSDASTQGVSAWSWDFGDGSTSSLQNPSHVYSTEGTYSVRLTVSCGSNDDEEFKTDFIQVVSGTPASIASNNGSGVNPDVLTSRVDPVVGTTWIGEVDGGAVGATGLTFFVGYEATLPGLSTAFGELLVDPSSPFTALDVGILTLGIATHDLPIPNEVELLGFTFSGQVLLNNVGGAGQLTNRLDFVLGV